MFQQFFRHTAQAQQQADQKQKTPDCCCFNFLPCFARKAVIDNQQQPEPPFIEDQERMIKDLEYKVGHMEKGKVTTGLFSSGGMGKNGGGLFGSGSLSGTGGLGKNGGGLFGTGGLSGGSMGGSLFGTGGFSREALDALHSGGSP